MGEKNLGIKRADQAFKNFDKAAKLKNLTPDQKIWAQYRLGVSLEVKGDAEGAAFYYGGGGEGRDFFAPDPKVENWVRFGLEAVLVKKRNRTFEEIQALEKSDLKYITKEVAQKPIKSTATKKRVDPRPIGPPDPEGKSIIMELPKPGQTTVNKEYGVTF